MNVLHEAALAGDVEATRRALSDIDVVDLQEPKYGNTPLMLAAYNNHPAVVSLLLEAGADVDARDFEQNTALMKAAWSGAAEPINLLLNFGADVDAVEQVGMTALMIAAFYGRTAIARALVKRGALVHLRAADGLTASEYARERGHHQLAQFLDGVTPAPSDALPTEKLADTSMNFDIQNVQPFLTALADRLEGGFTPAEAAAVSHEIAILTVDDERDWHFNVYYGGRTAPLWVSAFMDDYGASDITIRSVETIVAIADEELGKYLT